MASVDQSLSMNLPAPKTFAPSREDVLSTLGFFFGDPATPEKLKDYSEHRTRQAHQHAILTCQMLLVLTTCARPCLSLLADAMTYHFPGT